jgi:hypothetical protein
VGWGLLKTTALKLHWVQGGLHLLPAAAALLQVYVWDANTCKLLYKLPGHTGSVNEV